MECEKASVNTVQKVDVAQRVDEQLSLYTNIRLRHQRNNVPLHLLTDYNGLLSMTAQNWTVLMK
jgi:hypothetical protein